MDLELLRSLPQGAVHAGPDCKLEEVLENNECKRRVDTIINDTMHWMLVEYGQKYYVFVFPYCIAISDLLLFIKSTLCSCKFQMADARVRLRTPKIHD